MKMTSVVIMNLAECYRDCDNDKIYDEVKYQWWRGYVNDFDSNKRCCTRKSVYNLNVVAKYENNYDDFYISLFHIRYVFHL